MSVPDVLPPLLESNVAPTESEARQLKWQLSLLNSQLVQLRDRTAQGRQQGVHCQAMRCMDRIRGLETALLALRRMPPEMQQEIFARFCANDVACEVGCGPALLAQVSRLWREVSQGTPELWTRFSVETGTSLSPIRASRIASFARRSRSRPLQIAALGQFWPELLQLPHLGARIETLHVAFSASCGETCTAIHLTTLRTVNLDIVSDAQTVAGLLWPFKDALLLQHIFITASCPTVPTAFLAPFCSGTSRASRSHRSVLPAASRLAFERVFGNVGAGQRPTPPHAQTCVTPSGIP
ncbi:hypothetical protein C8R43DRAFT_1118507 [Mycena crocata]|nr:hypothetical protein C8R43DRAFT_1118507 [Mycena crocata]